MANVRDLLNLAQDCYAQARVTINRDTKRALMQMGDDYLMEADELQHGRTAIHAAFPKPDLKIG